MGANFFKGWGYYCISTYKCNKSKPSRYCAHCPNFQFDGVISMPLILLYFTCIKQSLLYLEASIKIFLASNGGLYTISRTVVHPKLLSRNTKRNQI